jgi:hypothetical protein
MAHFAKRQKPSKEHLTQGAFFNDFHTQVCGCFFQVVENPLAVFSFVICQPLLDAKFAMLEQTIDQPGQFMSGGGYARRRAQFAAHPPVKGSQSGLALLQRDGGLAQSMGCLIDDTAGVAAQNLAPADAVVRAESRPGGEMLFAGPAAHVVADFPQDDLGREDAEAFDGRQVHPGPPMQLASQIGPGHQVMDGFAAGFAFRQRLGLLRGQLGHVGRGLLIAEMNCLVVDAIKVKGCLKHEKVFGPVISLERLLHVLALQAAQARQVVALAQIGAQDADVIGRTKGGVEQAEAVQALEPLTVLDVGLAPGNILDRPGIDQKDLPAGPFQDLKGRNPGDAGGLQGHCFNAAFFEPAGHLLQVLGEGAKGPHGLLAAVGGHRAPMFAVADVDAGGIGMKQRHGGLYFLLFVGSFLGFLLHRVKRAPGPRVARKNAIF